MTMLEQTDQIFFGNTGLDTQRVSSLVSDILHNSDDGELYLEYRQSENASLDDQRIKNASFNTSQGFGLRAVADEATAYAHSNEFSEEAIKRAGTTVGAVLQGHTGALALPPSRSNRSLYDSENPVSLLPFDTKVHLLEQIDQYCRRADSRISQVSASINCSWSAVQIVRSDGQRYADIRPLIRMGVSVVASQNGRMESGNSGNGGRAEFQSFFEEKSWKILADEAIRQAIANLDSTPAPSGEMTVVLGPGWPGVLLHEAVGHGLEGDFNRKKTSAFAGLVGERVAAPGVTVVDDGTMPGRRGSITIDDEGTPSGSTTLIEDGILKGFLQDRLNARLMGIDSTGNGRRQSYAHQPMPRMTNTYMLAGEYSPEEIIASVDDGIYASNFGGGQVDITNGKFVFSCTEAYKIEKGRVTTPLKGATIIGNGPDALTRVSMIGSDMELDWGIGTCGKNGQQVPVGVGQPTLRIDGITVGGTA